MTITMFSTTNKTFLAGFFTIVLGFFALGTSFAWAEESITTLSDEQKQAIEDKEDRLDEIKAKIKAYKNIIQLKQKQGAALSDQIESLEAQANKLQLEIDTNKKTITELETDITLLSDRVREKEKAIQHQKFILTELIRTYATDTQTTTARLLDFRETALNPFQDEAWTLETGDQMRELLAGLQSLRQSLLAEHSSLTEKKGEVDALRLKLEQRSDYLEGVKESKAGLLNKTVAEAKKYDALVDDLEKERESIENEIESIEAGKIEDLDLKDVPKFAKGLLGYPVKKITVSQRYGKTKFTRWYKFHNGIDYALPSGSDVLAAADGKVVAIGNNGRYAYGRYVAIDHGNGLVTMYGHLSGYKVSRGEKVKRGEVIAKSGNTGYSTGPHVHFTVFATKSFDVVPSKTVKSVKDIPVGATLDPAKYLP